MSMPCFPQTFPVSAARDVYVSSASPGASSKSLTEIPGIWPRGSGQSRESPSQPSFKKKTSCLELRKMTPKTLLLVQGGPLQVINRVITPINGLING